MQAVYDPEQDKLFIKCANLHETDQIRRLFGIEDASFDGRIAVAIDDFLKSGKNQFLNIADRSVGDLTPIINISTALMGSGRFNPGRNYLLDKMGVGFIEFDGHRHAMAQNPFLESLLPGASMGELQDLYGGIQRYTAMDCFRLFSDLNWLKAEKICVDIHLPILPRYFRHQLNSCKLVYLFRDPRDWILSLYHFFRHVHLVERGGDFGDIQPHIFREDGADLDEFLIKAIDGEFFHKSEHGFYIFPAVRDLLEDRLQYQDHPNMFFADYERARLDPAPFFADFARWIAGTDELPEMISEPDLIHAGELGTFKQQTGGQLGEGESDKVQNLGGWLRKGSPGDWRNHLSDEVKRYLKTRTGSLLVDAGYADHMDW